MEEYRGKDNIGRTPRDPVECSRGNARSNLAGRA